MSIGDDASIRIEIHDWRRRQHYKTRGVPWLKLFAADVRSLAWAKMSDAAVRLLIDLQVIALDKGTDGVIVTSVEELAWALRKDAIVLDAALQELDDRGWIKLSRLGLDESYTDSRVALDGVYREERRGEEEEGEEKAESLRDSGAGAPGSSQQNGDNPVESAMLKAIMPVLREVGFGSDDRNGSILKAIAREGHAPNSVEVVVRGLARLRASDPKLRKKGDGGELRLIYAKGKKTSLWLEAMSAGFKGER